jgi:hypothetical protein
LPTNKSRTKGFSKKSSTVPNKKTTSNISAKKLTQAQSEHLRLLLAKSPSIEKLDPEVYAKLQSTIYETVEKTIPEYKKWLNSAFGESIVSEDCPVEICSSCGNDCPVEICSSCGNDCPVEICSSCGNDCPTPVEHIVNRVANEAINAAMTAAIRYTLEAMSKSSRKEVSEAKMRIAVKKELIKAAKEIGKGK